MSYKVRTIELMEADVEALDRGVVGFSVLVFKGREGEERHVFEGSDFRPVKIFAEGLAGEQRGRGVLVYARTPLPEGGERAVLYATRRGEEWVRIEDPLLGVPRGRKRG